MHTGEVINVPDTPEGDKEPLSGESVPATQVDPASQVDVTRCVPKATLEGMRAVLAAAPPEFQQFPGPFKEFMLVLRSQLEDQQPPPGNGELPPAAASEQQTVPRNSKGKDRSRSPPGKSRKIDSADF